MHHFDGEKHFLSSNILWVAENLIFLQRIYSKNKGKTILFYTKNILIVKKIAFFVVAFFLMAGIVSAQDASRAVGSLTGKSGGTYKGERKKGVFHGHGTYTWNNGDVYEGEFKDGKMDGFGIYTWADGDTYQGNFKDGLQEGEGMAYYAKKNNMFKGNWHNGKRNGKHITGHSYRAGLRRGREDTAGI